MQCGTRLNKYEESAIFDDGGDHDKDGDYKGGAETAFTGLVRGYAGGAVSEWSRSQARNSLHPARTADDPRDWVDGKYCGSIWADRISAWLGDRPMSVGDRPKIPEKILRKSTPPSLQATAPFNPVQVRHVVPLRSPAQDEEHSYMNASNIRK
jgi:hypothetical protein